MDGLERNKKNHLNKSMLQTCSIADRIGADACGIKESKVSTRTSINSGDESLSKSSSPDESRSSGAAKAFLQHMTSSEAASQNSPGRRSTWSSNMMSKYLNACNLFASLLRPQFLSCHYLRIQKLSTVARVNSKD